MEWRVAYSRMMTYGEGSWKVAPECSTVFHEQRSCVIEDLSSMTLYNVKVWIACTDSGFNSLPFRTQYSTKFPPVTTRPIPALAPPEVFCTGIEPLQFKADWRKSDPNDCTFFAWELQAKLLPRLEGVSASGLFEKAAAGGEYVTKCLTYSRNDLSCMVTDLLADRDYHIQARERCTDPFADSEYYRRYVECRTLTAPAEDPEGLTVADGDLYTMQVAWVPGDPKACIFLYMDVQVKENGTDWPEGDNPPVFGCRVANRSITKCA
ncbi:unnamed protein product, partial [Polarella glacialis]